MGRRWFLGVMVSFLALSCAPTSPAQARGGLRGGNMAEFVKRQAEKQRAKKERIEEEKAKQEGPQKEKKTSDE